MTILYVLILGAVEGVTEFLPVSSTGHLILTSSLLHIAPSAFLTSFEIAIQLGAILSVLLLYWKKFLDLDTIKHLIVAFLPTAVIGLALYKVVKAYLLTNDHVVVWALLVGGVVLVAFEYFWPQTTGESARTKLTYADAALIGLFQSIAIVPGVSRSAASIIGGLSLGLSRENIVEFSFLLAVPTMAAATGLDLIKNASAFSVDQVGMLLLGCGVACVTALAAIQFLLSYIRRHTFVPFGIYRIILAVVLLMFVL